MDNKSTSNIHWSFWLISGLMLIWNVMGCVNYFVQMIPEMLATYRESERIIIEGRPVWATAAFAVAVFGGAAGCVLLLIRRSAAIYLFIASLLGVVATMIHTLTIGIAFGISEIVGIILMPLVAAIFLVWYANFTKQKAWIS